MAAEQDTVDQDDAIIAEVAGDLDGVAPIGLAVLAGASGNERRSGEVTLESQSVSERWST